MSKIQGKINKTHKLAHLEQAWNSNVAYNQDSKRLSQMSNDIKSFITRSMSNEQDPFQKHNLMAKKIETSGGDLFSTISSAFGFTHHEGTDPNAELKVIKVVLVREGFLMSLRYLTDKARKNDSVDKSCASILELLAQIRESTLNYLEALCLWRQTAEETETPRMFYWERKNYTIKIVTDLDFLAENAVIVSTLGIPESQFRANPLMLTNNLEDMNTWMDPQERAVFDCNGRQEGAQFESRLRLRFAERILLQEVELASAEAANEPQGDDSQQIFLTQQQGSDQQSSQGPAYQHYQYQQQQQMYQDQEYQQQQYDQQQYQQQMYQQQQYQQQQIYQQQQYQQYDQSYGEEQQLARGSTVLEEEDDYEDERFSSPPDALSSQKSTWGTAPPAMIEDMPRARSADSASSMQHPGGAERSVPNSRSSTISYGFSSAPSSSQASRGAAIRLSANPAPPSVPVASSFEFGHDFFSGNWGDGSKRSTADTDIYSTGGWEQPPQQQQQQQYPETYSQQEGSADEIYYADNGAPSPDQPFVSSSSQQQSGPPPPHHYHNQGGDAASVQSVDTVSGADIALLAQIQTPPKELVLAGSACIILLSSGSKVPLDLSWGAFLRLLQVIDVSTAMRTLEPAKITKFKLVALLPFLQLLTSDPNLERVRLHSMPYPEYIACSRFVSWVKQFTASGLKKLPKQQQPSGSTSPKKTLVSTAGHRLPAPSKVVLHPIQVDKRAAAAAAAGALSSTKSSSKSTSGPPSSFKKPVSRAAAAATAQRKGVSSQQDDNHSPTGGALKNNKVIPKVSLELVPCHNEVVEGRYKNALLLVLMASPSSAALVKKSANESSVLLAADDRLVTKVIDIAESRETSLTLNLREYTLFAEEMRVKHGSAAMSAFSPQDLSWWVRTVGQLIVVAASSKGGVGGGGSLKLSISRRVIEDLIVKQKASTDSSNKDAVPSVTIVEPVDEQNSTERVQSGAKSSRQSPTGFSAAESLPSARKVVEEVRSARGSSGRSSARSVAISSKESSQVLVAAESPPPVDEVVQIAASVESNPASSAVVTEPSVPINDEIAAEWTEQVVLADINSIPVESSSDSQQLPVKAQSVQTPAVVQTVDEEDVNASEYYVDAFDEKLSQAEPTQQPESSPETQEQTTTGEVKQSNSNQEEEGEEGAYGEEAFEEDKQASVVLKETAVFEGDEYAADFALEESTYGADFEGVSMVIEAAAPVATEESAYGNDFEEPSQVAVNAQDEEEEDSKLRHALSESITGLAIRAAELDLESHPELIHNHSVPVAAAEEEDSYLLDEYEEDSVTRAANENGSSGKQAPSIIEQVQQEFDDFEDVDTDMNEV